MKNKGNESIFNTGFIVAFRSHMIIHHNKYVFQASIHSGVTITAVGCESLFNKNQIKNSIEAFSKIDRIIFIKKCKSVKV
jgi:hypothetical protein